MLKAALPLMREIGTTASRFVFLGAGPAHGIAWEAMLKMTEMAQRVAVAYHPLEFRHGPIAVAGPGAVAVLFGTDAGATMETALVRDLAAQINKTPDGIYFEAERTKQLENFDAFLAKTAKPPPAKPSEKVPPPGRGIGTIPRSTPPTIPIERERKSISVPDLIESPK